MNAKRILKGLFVGLLGVTIWLATLLAPVAVQAATNLWHGEYFRNTDLAGYPAVVRDDAKIDFNWGYGSPHEWIAADRFSVRWTRSAYFDGGHYRFTTTSDDGVRLYVDERLVIDRWYDMPVTSNSATLSLSRGTHSLRLEYYENQGGAFARLDWQQIDPRYGNIVTCVRPVDSWIKVYRLDGSTWTDVNPHGWGPLSPAGNLKLDGMLVDEARYGAAGHPYRVELWAAGSLIRSAGDTARGEPEFRVRAGVENPTPWGCPAP